MSSVFDAAHSIVGNEPATAQKPVGATDRRAEALLAGTAAGDTTSNQMPALSLDAAVRTLIREELAGIGPRPSTQTESAVGAREIFLLVVAAVDIGLFLSLIPDVGDAVKLVINIVLSLTGTTLAVMYGRLRATKLHVIRHPATHMLVTLVMLLLTTAHLARNFEVVEILVEPSDTMVFLGDTPLDVTAAGEDQGLAFVTMREHTVHVKPTGAGAHGREFQITTMDAMLTALGGGPITPPPLMCEASIQTSPLDQEVRVEVSRCDLDNGKGEDAEHCQPISFDRDYVNLSVKTPKFQFTPDQRVDADKIIFTGDARKTGVVPAGHYRVRVEKDGCMPQDNRMTVDVRRCKDAEIRFGKLTC